MSVLGMYSHNTNIQPCFQNTMAHYIHTISHNQLHSAIVTLKTLKTGLILFRVLHSEDIFTPISLLVCKK